MTNHMTYVAASCTKCHDDALRVCVSHDACEFDHHDANECVRVMYRIEVLKERIARDQAELARKGF